MTVKKKTLGSVQKTDLKEALEVLERVGLEDADYYEGVKLKVKLVSPKTYNGWQFSLRKIQLEELKRIKEHRLSLDESVAPEFFGDVTGKYLTNEGLQDLERVSLQIVKDCFVGFEGIEDLDNEPVEQQLAYIDEMGWVLAVGNACLEVQLPKASSFPAS